MEVTTGQALVSLSVTITGGVVVAMIIGVIRRMRSFGEKVDKLEEVVDKLPEDILTMDKHGDLCRIRELEIDQRTRDLFEEMKAAFTVDIKDHITETIG